MTVFQDNIRLSSDIFTFLKEPSSGEVLLTTSKGVYLQFSSRIIMLTDAAFGISPIGIGLSRFVDFLTVIAPKTGQPVLIQEGQICFPGGIVEGNWELIPPKFPKGDLLSEQITYCADLLSRQCNERSVARLAAPLLLGRTITLEDPVCERSLPVLQTLLDGLTDFNTEKIHSSVNKLLGLGHGLTPSMDDVLLGLLYGLQRFAPHKVHTSVLRDVILNEAQTHTNAISAAYLSAVAQGAYFERLDFILAGLYNDITIDIAPMLEIGSSSGSEILFGLLLAAKITKRG